ncbi:MAG: Mu transposase C-terminal domain-containing protein [Pseudomonadota bacterium]
MSEILSFAPGALLTHQRRECVVLDLVDVQNVLVRFAEDGEIQTLGIDTLDAQPVEVGRATSERAQRLVSEVLPLISDKRWTQARTRLLAMRDLINAQPYRRGAQKVQEAATVIGRSPATVYRLLADYDRTQSLRVFLRLPRADKGKRKILAKVDRLIRAVIKKEYLTDQRKMISTVAEAVEKRCKKKGWPFPHKSTVARRIQELLPREVVQAREGRKAARGRHDLQRGQHPEVLYPLDLWQMDHTPSDYCIVDEVYRRPIDGAQTLTVALDINTRCIAGFTLMMEAPSVRVAGACMAHAILPKERFLQEIEVDAVWPCYGLPKVVYTDNASEFEGKYFLMACEINGIETRKRPKGAPNFAGHIESLFRTFLQKVHELEGARFANLVKRMEYDSTGRAIMTIQEFRRWFTIFITKYYHQKSHSGLAELPPIKAWERGIIGTGDTPGIGIPDRVSDEFRLRVDFLPGTERSIQDYGIAIERLQYADTVLRRWVGSRDPEDPKKARKFIIKYDPYDMTEVYFLDPEIRQYFAIPAVGELEHITLWENTTLKRQLRRDNRGHVNHELIAEGLDEMRGVTEVAAKTTKKARRAQQRLIDSKRHSLPKQRRAKLEEGLPAELPVDEPDDDVVVPLPGGVAPAILGRP